MYTILFVNTIAILILIYCNQMKVRFNVLPAVIMMLAIIYGLRYDYGNDYSDYLNMFQTINSRSARFISHSKFFNIEPGWIWLNRLFKPLGFEGLIIFLTFIQLGVMGWFIMKFVPRKYQWQALALYIFLPGFMVTEFSMLRQSLAMSIILIGVAKVLGRKFIQGLVFFALSMLFHRSGAVSIMFIPLYFLRNINYKWALLGYSVIVLVCQFFAAPLVNIIESVVSMGFFDKYENYYRGNNVVVEMRSGLGFIFQMILNLYVAYLLKFKSTKYRYFIVCLLFGYAFLPLTGSVGLVSRIIYYFQHVGILGFLPLFKRASKDVMAFILTAVFIAYIASANYIFFTLPIFVKKFFYYRTLFDK